MAKQITMETELLVELLGKRGFILDEDNRLKYASGSISNYTKMTISQPVMHYSLELDSEAKACFVRYESFSEPGYIECDWKKIEEGYVRVEKLTEYLDGKGIRNADEVKREREERWAQIRARRAQ